MSTSNTFSQYKKELLKNSSIKAEYDRLKPEFAVIRAVLHARQEKGLSQKQLAEAVGTKQSAIARLESGKSNPSIGFLYKVGKALGFDLTIAYTKSA